MNTTEQEQEVTLSLKVIRADGTVEDLGQVWAGKRLVPGIKKWLRRKPECLSQ